MSPELVILLITLVVGTLFVLGSPVVLCMGAWVVAVSYFAEALPLSNVGQSAQFGLKIFALLAMPLFILTGDLINAGGIAQKLTRFATVAFRFVPGQLAVATTVACGCFAAISGSNAATAATMGRILIPEMRAKGYDPHFAAATAAAGGVVGVIIPPSLIFVIYGVLLGVSPGDLFIAGIVPGILMVAFMAVGAALMCRWKRWDPPGRTSVGETVRAAWGAKWGFLGIAIALAGIFAGLFSPTEVAGVVVIYAIVAGLLLSRELKVREIPGVLLQSAIVNGLIAPIVGFSIILQETFAAVGVPQLLNGYLAPLMSGYWPAILTSMLVVFLVGMVLESVPTVILIAPILAPLAVAAGVHPIHFAIVFCVGSAIGFVTPPYGLNLFVVAGISGLPYMSVAARVLPYLVLLLICWLLIAAIPALSLFFIK